jgi:hypothetical protein
VGGASGLSADAAASIGLYGLRQAALSVEEIADLTRAKQYAIGYFNQNALPAGTGDIEIEPAEVWVDFIDPTQSGSPAAGCLEVSGIAAPFTQYPVRVTYSLEEAGQVKLHVEMEQRKPNATLLLLYALGGDPNRKGVSNSRTLSNLDPSPWNSIPVLDPTAPTVPVLHRWGPEEPAPYTRAWDAAEEDRSGGTQTITFYDDEGNPKAPNTSWPILLFVGNNPVPTNQWTLLENGYEVEIAAGYQPIAPEGGTPDPVQAFYVPGS